MLRTQQSEMKSDARGPAQCLSSALPCNIRALDSGGPDRCLVTFVVLDDTLLTSLGSSGWPRPQARPGLVAGEQITALSGEAGGGVGLTLDLEALPFGFHFHHQLLEARLATDVLEKRVLMGEEGIVYPTTLDRSFQPYTGAMSAGASGSCQ